MIFHHSFNKICELCDLFILNLTQTQSNDDIDNIKSFMFGNNKGQGLG